MPEERKVRVKSRETEHKEAFGAVVKARKKLHDAKKALEAAADKHAGRIKDLERELSDAEKRLRSFEDAPEPASGVTVTVNADEPE